MVAGSDVVITTAAVPGQKSPVLVTKAAVEGMVPGSVIVDLAAERGGNCELTQAGQRVVHNGVTILGPLNLPAEIPQHASQMYAKNISTFLLNLVKDKQVQINLEDEIIRDTLIARDGQIVCAQDSAVAVAAFQLRTVEITRKDNIERCHLLPGYSWRSRRRKAASSAPKPPPS